MIEIQIWIYKKSPFVIFQLEILNILSFHYEKRVNQTSLSYLSRKVNVPSGISLAYAQLTSTIDVSNLLYVFAYLLLLLLLDDSMKS